MRTHICAATLVAGFAMAACAIAPSPPKQWFKQGGWNDAELSQDAARCDYETSIATQNIDTGLRTVLGQELDRAQRKRELTDLCMRAKGWQ